MTPVRAEVLQSSDTEDLRDSLEAILVPAEHWNAHQVSLVIEVPSKAYYCASSRTSPPQILRLYGDAPETASALHMLAPYLRAVADEVQEVADEFEETYGVVPPAIPNNKVPEWKFRVQSETVLPSDEGDDQDSDHESFRDNGSHDDSHRQDDSDRSTVDTASAEAWYRPPTTPNSTPGSQVYPSSNHVSPDLAEKLAALQAQVTHLERLLEDGGRKPTQPDSSPDTHEHSTGGPNHAETTSIQAQVADLERLLEQRDRSIAAKDEEIRILRQTLSYTEARQTEERDRLIAAKDEEIESLHEALSNEQAERRLYYESYASLRGTIRVAVRVRPPKGPAPQTTTWQSTGGTLTVSIPNRTSVSPVGKTATATEVSARQFHFDRVFQPEDDNEVVFREVQSLVRAAVEGSSVLVFAYGTSGTGKTHTINAMQASGVEALFEMLARKQRSGGTPMPLLKVACTAVYRDDVQDLLSPSSVNPTILILERTKTLKGLPDGTTVVQIRSKAELQKQLKRARDKSVRAETKLNTDSSRGHTLFTIMIPQHGIESDAAQQGYLTFVDLAGNENVEESGVQGVGLQEALNINKGLSALKTVFTDLNNGQKPNWKQTTLTTLIGGLMEMGGDTKPEVLMIATTDLSEPGGLSKNLRTLEFAQMASSTAIKGKTLATKTQGSKPRVSNGK